MHITNSERYVLNELVNQPDLNLEDLVNSSAILHETSANNAPHLISSISNLKYIKNKKEIENIVKGL